MNYDFDDIQFRNPKAILYISSFLLSCFIIKLYIFNN